MALPANLNIDDIDWSALVESGEEQVDAQGAVLMMKHAFLEGVKDTVLKNKDKLKSGKYTIRPRLYVKKAKTKEERLAHQRAKNALAKLKREFGRATWEALQRGHLVWANAEAKSEFESKFRESPYKR